MRSLISFTLLLAMMLIGCGDDDSKPAPQPADSEKPTVQEKSQSENKSEVQGKRTLISRSNDSANIARNTESNQPTDTDPKPTSKSNGGDSTSSKITTTTASSTEDAPAAEVDLSYITDDFIAALMIRPKQLIESNYAANLIESALGQEEFDAWTKEIAGRIGFDPRSIRQVTFLMDRSAVSSASGIQPPGATASPRQAVAFKNNFKMIGLAFHNYHDTYRKFPRHDGPAEVTDRYKRGLSWRVHLLPFLEHVELYRQFHLDEPWDSDHNKTLIDQMPDVLKTPGVSEQGKTSIHVFAGQGTPFDDNVAPRIPDYQDGTSNTFLAVAAGADKAEIWTKPGGLKLNSDAPASELGKISDNGFLALFADGYVMEMPAALDAVTLTRLIQHQDGQTVSIRRDSGRSRQRQTNPVPAFVAHLTTDVDIDKLLPIMAEEFGKPNRRVHGELTYHSMQGFAVCLPNKRTAIAAREDLLKKMLDNKAGKSGLKTKLLETTAVTDLVAAIHLKPMQPTLGTLLERMPQLSPVSRIDDASISLSLSGKSNDSLLRLEVVTADETAARELEGLIDAYIANLKQQWDLIKQNPQLTRVVPAGLRKLGGDLIESATLNLDGTKVVYNIAIPDDYDAVIESMKPQFQQLGAAIREARETARRAVRHNGMMRILIAMHNYHETYRVFPRANGPGTHNPNKELNLGLSWRVYLLPFLDEAELYEKFHLNEPWDSEHNKALINQMPDVYKTPGVNESGKTSLHVFLGDGALFGDGKTARRIRDIIDGTANTLMTVVAGPDKAAVWTKPGGLKFDPKMTKAALGKVVGNVLLGFADGHIQEVPAEDLTNELLRLLIQHADGQPIPAF